MPLPKKEPTEIMSAADITTDTELGTSLVIPHGVSSKCAIVAVRGVFIDLIEFLPTHDVSDTFGASEDCGNT